jgi:predicted ATP-grasp superfamily ATP-dependent carboligase
MATSPSGKIKFARRTSSGQIVSLPRDEGIDLLELIIINYNMYELICNKYILYNGLSNYICNEVIKFCIGFIICHEKWTV